MDKSAATLTTSFTLNGEIVQVEPTPGERLSHSLRERLDRKDVKIGCNAGDCGACTVLLDGEQVCSCLVPVAQVAGRDVTTVEGLAGTDGRLSDLQQAFHEYGAAQCGICTPGFLVAAKDLLERNDNPSETEVRYWLAGNLCRCTGYDKIIRAVMDTAADMRGAA